MYMSHLKLLQTISIFSCVFYNSADSLFFDTRVLVFNLISFSVEDGLLPTGTGALRDVSPGCYIYNMFLQSTDPFSYSTYSPGIDWV